MQKKFNYTSYKENSTVHILNMTYGFLPFFFDSIWGHSSLNC